MLNAITKITFEWLVGWIIMLMAFGLCHAAIINVPGECTTIQAGIDAASNGDIVLVANGTYTGAGNKNLDFTGKAITVKSANGAAHTVIDCQGGGRGFLFHSGEGNGSQLIGFTITNGYVDGSSLYGGKGGGIHCSYSSPTISNCIISHCTATGFGGGGILLNSSTTRIENTIVEYNSAEVTGAGILIVNGSPTIYNSIIQHNKTTGYSSGGGICIIGASATVSHCTISYNESNINYNYVPSEGKATNSGGISFRDGSTALLESSVISHNKAQERGGIGSWDASPTILNCLIENNEATLFGGGGIGLHSNSNATILRSTIKNNTAREYGGGVSVWNSTATSSGPKLTDCIIENNNGGVSSGGINVLNSSAKIYRSIIKGNIADSRAGLGFKATENGVTSSLLVNNLIVDNAATSFGGGVTCFSGADTVITNSTIVNNTSGSGSGGVYLDGASSSVANSILWDNSRDNLTGAAITYSDVASAAVFPGTGNINSDPLFTSTSDFHLTQFSPCIDTGNNGASHTPLDDIGGNNRDGQVDLGCYEYPNVAGGPGTSGTIGADITPVVPPLGPPGDSDTLPGVLFMLLR